MTVGRRVRAVWTVGLTALGLSAALVTAPSALAAAVPDAPLAVHADEWSGRSSVSWAEPSDGGSPITGYVVDLGDGSGRVSEIPAGRTSAHLSGLVPGVPYRPCVYAVNALGRSLTCGLSDSTIVAGLPDSPRFLDVVQHPDGTVRVWWDAADHYGPAVDRYTVTISPSGATATLVPPAGPPPIPGYSVDFRGLRSGMRHTVSITATNSVGTGAATSVEVDLEAFDELSVGHTLFPGEELRSRNGRYSLTMQEDGNVVVYADDTRPLWDTRTWGRPGAELDLQDDGNLVLYSSRGEVLWSTATWGNPGSRLVVQDDGNLVLYAAGGSVLWSSGWDMGAGVARDTLWSTQQLTTDQFLVSRNGRYALTVQSDGNTVVHARSGRPLWDTRTFAGGGRRLVLQPDGNLVLYDAQRQAVWNSLTWGNPGARLVLQDDGNLVLYSDRGVPLWSSGWDLGAGAVRDTLWPTQQLVNGQSLVSRNGHYALTMQTDGNLVVYAPGRRPLWSTSTYSPRPHWLSLQPDGNLVLLGWTRRPMWDTRTWGQQDVRLVMQDDGNLVLYTGTGRALWSSVYGRVR